jgi:hypothetical protein
MTEATQRPWYASHDGNGYDHIQSAAVNEDNYVARVDSTDAQGNANADLIVKAVNSHDALVAALEACQIALRTHSPNVPEDEQGWTSYDEEAIEAATEALEQVK